MCEHFSKIRETQIAYFPSQFHFGAKQVGKPASEPIAWLYRFISEPKKCGRLITFSIILQLQNLFFF